MIDQLPADLFSCVVSPCGFLRHEREEFKTFVASPADALKTTSHFLHSSRVKIVTEGGYLEVNLCVIGMNT